MVRLCAAAHPYYKWQFEELGLAVTDFRSVDDLKKLGVLHKETYTADPESFRLNLDGIEGLSLEESNLADVIYTSGSTGDVTPFYDTVHDRFARIEHIRRGRRSLASGNRTWLPTCFRSARSRTRGF